MNQLSHERTDVSAKLVAYSIAGLAAAVVIAGFLMAGMFAWLEHHQPAGPTISPLAGPRELPPQPRLQVSPQHEWGEYEKLEDQKVDRYKWIDRNSGIVRIPVDRAMDLLLERGIAPVSRNAMQPPGTPQGSEGRRTLPAGPIGGGGPADVSR